MTEPATKPARRMRELLAEDGIVVSPGVYDGYSVRMVEKMGFRTACTTGAGLANSRMGVPDVGIMGLTDNLEACRMMARSVSIPVMADADTGYGNAIAVYHTIERFEEAGLAGINIEDQVSPKRCGHMTGKDVIDMREMARKIEAACDARKDDDFIVLARTDAIAVEGIEGAIRRARLYAAAGADLIFADAIGGEEQIKRLVDASPVPVSVNMGFGIRNRPTTPLIPVKRLEALGVKRVTLPRMLPAAALMAMENALSILKGAMESGEVADHPDLLYGIDDIWALMGQPEIKAMEQRYADLDAIALPEDRAAS
ncbi:MAG: isocitrate lyase/PEP mutase family protein [Roseitalea sp.]|jgi:2-methylisocitrate lyase-like PEP mutase family enzyme|nr:isocitrate lyase/PEP mutase family protein [Roseitalea sp.]MBO6953760.1 isocitrate lyase/PEP mutase family protein [Rhizobiaceae bacterium]MBO6594108.1 isocitrate lyase/PEP mutase family protein [Roseitalea sp.]MBO6601459.1 isocitrate lyase/PEP mutase family protein [Roseitalea sp.]MBO6613549.1 isocitrate lyase/PEP mutase family protein [Roseitalea sp.]